MMRVALFLLGLCLACSAWAEDEYYWRDMSTGATGPTFTGLYALRWPEFEADFPPPNVITFAPCEYNNGAKTEVACKVTVERPGLSDFYTNVIIRRYGSTCPENTTYNLETGGCDLNDCLLTVGQKLAARGPNSEVVTSGDGSRSILPAAFDGACSDGCYYWVESSFGDRTSCYLLPGSEDTGFCNYLITGVGETCPATNFIPAAGGDPLNTPPDPDPDAPDPGCGPGYSWTGDFCAKDPDEPDDPDDPSDPGEGDGDGDGGGSGGDGGGSGGGGGGNGGGDDDGETGGGQGGGGDEGGGGDGDAQEGLVAPERGSFEEAIAEYEQKIDDISDDLKAASGRFSDLIQNKIDIKVTGGNAALPCFDAEVMNKKVGFCFSTYSDQLSILRNLILFLAAVIAFFIIFREDK
ncbi:attachment protein [Pseudomonas sp.]|uniref:attachment protein n=1 Tax=Pseudomonas sp. TaxID=306 RepID=UPI003CC60DB7